MSKHFQVDTGGTLTTGLVSYYKLGDTSDYYGSNTLTNTGSVSFSTGKINNAADFGSSNTTKRLNYTGGNLGIDGGNCSISLWFNPSAQPATNGSFVLSSQGAGNGTKVSNDISYIDVSGTKKITFYRNKYGVATQGSEYTTTLSNGTWYHIVYTYDGTNVRGYLNGSLVGGPTAASGNGSNDYGTGLGIGVNASNLNQGNTSGLIDEVGIWSKALSTTEIADLYNSGNGQTMIDQQNITLAMGAGSYTYTGYTATFTKSRVFRLVMGAGSYVLTGFDAILRKTGWNSLTKHTTSWTEKSKNNTTWSGKSKH